MVVITALVFILLGVAFLGLKSSFIGLIIFSFLVVAASWFLCTIFEIADDINFALNNWRSIKWRIK